VSRTGLLLMDLQNAIVSRYANDPAFIARLQKVTEAARNAAMPIIYVVVRFRPHYPEVSARNKSFSALKDSGFSMEEGNEAAEIHSAFPRQPTDIIVTKRRVGAFSGSDLDIVLRSQDIHHIILTGIATSGVVLSTLRAAADLDFPITVLSDCCYDKDPEVHKVLMEKVFPMQAEVLTAEQWLARF
jgi:nicotinamidase-related amidase